MMIRPSNRLRLPDLILIAAFITIAGLYVMLMVSDRVPLPGVILLGALWLIYWVLGKRISYATPLDFSILFLLGLLLITYKISVNISLTMPKVYGLLLGAVIFYWIVNYINDLPRLRMVIFGLFLLSFAIPLLGLLGADWSVSSYSLPGRIADGLTSRLGFLERLSSGGGIHVNTIGGTLAFFVPLLLGLILDGGAFKQAPFFKQQPRESLIIIYKLSLAFVLALVVFVLFLTESRGSYFGSAVGVMALLVWKDRRFLWLIPFLIVVLIVVFVVVANSNLTEFIALLDTTQENNTLQVRWDYWKRTLFLIQDFPFTGAGLGVYNKIFQGLYLFSTFASEIEPSFYAHNLYLGVAASLGIPALVLYFTLFSSYFHMVLTSFKHAQPVAKVVMMGLCCGFLSHLIYGLFDNYLPGEKLGAVMWIYFGVVTAIFVHQEAFSIEATAEVHDENQQTRSRFPRWLVAFIIGLIGLISISLAAVGLINEFPILSLILAVCGGILLGVLQTSIYRTTATATALEK